MSDDTNLMSIDTGNSGNIFGGHFFDQNEDHLKGKLKQVQTDFKRIEGNRITIKPQKEGRGFINPTFEKIL